MFRTQPQMQAPPLAYLYVCNKNGTERLSLTPPKKGRFVPGTIVELVPKRVILDHNDDSPIHG